MEGNSGVMQAVRSEAMALLLPDAITRPEVVGVFAVFLIVLAAFIGIMVMVFRGP